MSDNYNWLRTAASFGTLAAVGVGIGVAIYAGLNEWENRQNQQRYSVRSDHSQSNRNRNNHTGGGSSGWNNGRSSGGNSGEDSRQQLERERILAEARRRQLQNQEKEERERKSLEETRKRLEEEKKAREEREKQLESDQKLKEEEEEKIRQNIYALNCFSDEYDEAVGVSTKNEHFEEDFVDWSNSKQKQQLKKEFREKQQAKNLDRQNDKEDENECNDDVVRVMYVSYDREEKENQSTNTNQEIDSPQDSPGEYEDAPAVSTVKKPKTEAQKAARRQKKKSRRQRKRAENAMKFLNLKNEDDTDEDK